MIESLVRCPRLGWRALPTLDAVILVGGCPAGNAQQEQPLTGSGKFRQEISHVLG